MSALRTLLGTLLVVLSLGPAHARRGKIEVKLLRPESGAAFGLGSVPPRIVLRWAGSGPVRHYVLQIAKGRTVATYEVRGETAFTFRPGECGEFSWWVAGVGTDGRTTQPGEVRTFTVTLNAPAPCEPPEGKIFPFHPEGATIQFSWDRRPVTRYRIELARDKGFSGKLESRSETKPGASARMESPGTVYWRVRGLDPDTAWSRARSFKVALPVPEPLQPEDGATVELTGPSVSVELSWKPVPVADSYFVDLRRKGGRGRKHPYQTRDTQILARDLPAGAYAWRVRTALDSGPESDPSPERTFVLIPGKQRIPEAPATDGYPAPPKLLAPEDGTRIVTPTPQPVLLFWQLAEGAAGYEVELSRQGGFSRVEVRRGVKGPMVSIAELPQGTWYWRVRAVDSDGVPGEWTDAWVFTHRVRPNWGDW